MTPPTGQSSITRPPFGAIVRDALIERNITTPIGNPNWAVFAHGLPDVAYESFRKAVTGDRRPSPRIMERVAEALGLEPSVFPEYQLWLAQRSFDPAEVGEDEAFANLMRWMETNR